MSTPTPADQPSTAAFAAPYRLPAAPRLPEQRTAPRSPALGLVALAVALIALIGSVTVAVVAIGQVAATATITGSLDAAGLRALSPAREWVLVGEAAFWIGTALGLWALIQGVIAIAVNRGRGFGIGAVAVAAVAPAVFGAVVLLLVLTSAAPA